MEDTTIEDVLKTFESYYGKQDYPNALLTLQEHKNEMSPGIWHYNMGTVFAKMDRLSEARFHFLMAQKRGLNSHSLNQNQKIVDDKLEINRLEKPQSTMDYLVKASLFAADGLLTTLSLLILFLGLWILKKQADVRKIILFLVLVLTPIGLNFWITSWHRAVIKNAVSVNDGPSVIFGPVAELPPGIMVVLKGEGEWLQVIYPSRFRGWIKNTELIELE